MELRSTWKCEVWKATAAPQGMEGMSFSLDIEELRTQVASERLAREQGDDRCMECMRDLIGEQAKRKELQMEQHVGQVGLRLSGETGC